MKKFFFILYNTSVAACLLYLANLFLTLVVIPDWVLAVILITGASSFFANAMIRRSELKKQREAEERHFNK